MENNRFFAINLRKLRDQKNWSQQELADRADVSLQTIFRAESKNIIPRGANISKIAEALGVTESSLFGKSEIVTVKSSQSDSEMRPPTSADLLSAIVLALPALDESELRSVLSFIDDLTTIKKISQKSTAG